MANFEYVIVKSGLKPVHSFDLYGPLVDALKLGGQSIALAKDIANDHGLGLADDDSVFTDYQELLNGEPWTTGDKKGPIIDALQKITALDPDRQPDYSNVFQTDGLTVIREVLDAGEGAIVFSSKKPNWLRAALPEDIGERLGAIYGAPKNTAAAFKGVYVAEMGLRHRIVSHTADELPELESAVASGLFTGDKGLLVFVNRNDKISRDQALAAGIDSYVNDLTTIDYTSLVQK
jgi:hypothetical protein